MSFFTSRRLLLTSAALAALSTPAIAQESGTVQPNGTAPSTAGAEESVGDEIVVTARAGVADLRKVEASYAITTVNEEQLRERSPVSVAEALKSVPGLWVEASGGEASANIRARGIPQEGFSAVAMYEDGLPIQHDAGLGYLNADQSFRLDETIERIEVARGGPASIFASYAPGGIVNFITRKPGDTLEGLVKLQVGDYDMYRADAWLGGPIGEWRWSIGGFYRISDGVRDPGFRADEGGQIRASIGRDFERGSIDFNVKHLNDNVILYAGIPLTFDSDGDPAGVPGLDANTGTLSGPETDDLTLRGPNGPFDWDLSDGTDIKLTQATLKFDYEIFDGWRVENNMRYRDSKTKRIGLFPNSPVTAASRLASVRASVLAANPGATDVQLRYATSGERFDVANQNGNGLVIDGSLRWVDVPLEEFINDFRLLHEFDAGGQHDVALGFYFADVSESFRRYSATALLDVQDNARRLDLVAVNAAGQVIGSATENGISRYGAEFANADGGSTTIAAYASDEWQLTDQLRIDLGARWEKIDFEGRNERSRTINLGQSRTPADDTVLAGSGIFDELDMKFDDFGWTAGINWQFRPDMGVFARYTSAFRLPSLGDFLTNPTRTDIRKQGIDLAEAGYKLSTEMVSLYATAFYTAFDSYGFGERVFNPVTGGYDQRTEFTGTTTYGVELEGAVRPVDWFDVSFSATWQDAEFDDFTFTELVGGAPVQRDFSGNKLLRVPETSFRISPALNLIDDRLRIEFDVQHFGKRYADAANSVSLPAYTLLNLNIRFDVSEQLSLFAYGTNLTNEIGLTEGNPRSGQFVSGDAGARFYTARPELGRALRAAVLYRF